MSQLNDDDWEMVALVIKITPLHRAAEDAREREAICCLISRLGNQLMQHNTPWKLVKGRR